MPKKYVRMTYTTKKITKIDWSALEPAIRKAHDAGATSAEVAALVYGLGVTCSPQTIWNHMARHWGLYFKYPRVREPWKPERLTKANQEKNAPPTRIQMYIGPPEPHVPRLCVRPDEQPHRTLTAMLMGDPRPGRTPWAA